MVQELFIAFVVVVLRILFAIVLSAGAVYSGISLLDKLTAGIDEWKEIKKGNIAIAILFTAVMVAVLLIMEPRINDFVGLISAAPDVVLSLELLALSLLNYLLGLLASVILLFLTINLIDRITQDLDEFSELKKGNAAVGLILATAILLVLLVAKGPLETGFTMLKLLELNLLGLSS